MGEQLAIVAEGVAKRFGSVRALEAVDLGVPEGSVLGLLGPNGAGKTTLVRILATLLRPDRGRAWVHGRDVVRHPAQVRRVIGLSGQYAAVDRYLTGRENLHMIGRLSGLRRPAARVRADELIQSFGLADGGDREVRGYSGGMRRRLDVAASLVAAPRVLFLDEPTTGLDPRGRMALWRLLSDLTAQGTTLLLTTQYLEEADRLADRVVLIDAGRVIATGTPEELKARAGGDRLDLRVAPGLDPAVLATALSGIGSGPPIVDRELGQVVLPVADGPAALPAVAARMAEHGLRVADLQLRRPSLDDVFLTLTDRQNATLTDRQDATLTGRQDATGRERTPRSTRRQRPPSSPTPPP